MPLAVDSATSIAVGFAAGAGLVALVFTFLGVARRERGTDKPATGRERSRADAGEPLEATIHHLRRALERARAEIEWTRRLSGISSTIDLDAVLPATLETACALPGVDAGVIVVFQPEQEPLLATLGVPPEDAARHPLAATPDGRARPVRIDSGARDAEPARHEDRLRGGIAVSLLGEDDEVIGVLAVFRHGADRDPTDEELEQLESVASTAGPTIENARRFRAARQLADLDALTNLHNRRYFHETLAREVARAQRYDRRLALVVFDVDDFKSINDRVGHLAGDGVLLELAERVQRVVRNADVACRVGGDEFAVILPESTLVDAEQLYGRLQLAVAAEPAASADRLRLSAGIAELRPDDDPVTFFERADEALYRAKDAGKGQAVADSGIQ